MEMDKFNVKVNLQNLKCVVRAEKAKSGIIKCLVIPIEENNLFVGKKGVYLDMIAFSLRTPKKSDNGNSLQTHIVKQHFSKDVFDKMTEEEKKATPIMGDISVYEGGSNSEPVSSQEVLDEKDDLPF